MRKSVLAGLFAAGFVLCTAIGAQADAPAVAAAKPYLGVTIGPMEQAHEAGAVVRDVTSNSPAAKAGLKKGDVILQVGGKEVKNAEALVGMIAGHKPGDSLKLHVRRDGKEQDLNAVLAERPAPQIPRFPEFLREKAGAFLGVWTQPMSAELKKALGVPADQGAVVMQVMPGSPAANAGIANRDVIIAVNGQAVNTPDELRAAVQKAGAGKEATVKFFHGKEAKEAKVTLQESPFGFRGFRDFDTDFPKLFERFQGEIPPGLNQEMRQKIEELRKRVRELERQAPPASEQIQENE